MIYTEALKHLDWSVVFELVIWKCGSQNGQKSALEGANSNMKRVPKFGSTHPCGHDLAPTPKKNEHSPMAPNKAGLHMGKLVELQPLGDMLGCSYGSVHLQPTMSPDTQGSYSHDANAQNSSSRLLASTDVQWHGL